MKLIEITKIKNIDIQPVRTEERVLYNIEHIEYIESTPFEQYGKKYYKVISKGSSFHISQEDFDKIIAAAGKLS